MIAAEREIDQLVQQMKAEMLRTDPAVSGWQSMGVDIMRRLEDAPGGTEGNVLFGRDDETDSVIWLGAAQPMAIPAEWEVLEGSQIGVPFEGSGSTEVMSFRNAHYLVATSGHYRAGNALCSKGGFSAAIYREPNASEDEEVIFMAIFLQRLASVLREIEMCSIYAEVEPGLFNVRYYTPDGRPFVSLNDDAEHVTIRRIETAEKLFRAD